MLGVSHGELEMGRGLPELSGATGRNLERSSSKELAPVQGCAYIPLTCGGQSFGLGEFRPSGVLRPCVTLDSLKSWHTLGFKFCQRVYYVPASVSVPYRPTKHQSLSRLPDITSR